MLFGVLKNQTKQDKYFAINIKKNLKENGESFAYYSNDLEKGVLI